MEIGRRMMIAATAGVLLGFVVPSYAQDAFERVEGAKRIRIAVPTDYPPYGYVGTDMEPKGLDVDMARLIAEKLGVRLELVPVTAANRIPYLQTKKVELVISTLAKNPEREKVIDFTSSYAPFFIAVYAPKETTIKSSSDMAGKSVAVTRGETAEEELSKMAPPDLTFKRFEDNNATFQAFLAGQADAIATSATVAGVMVQKHPGLNMDFKILLKENPCYIGVGKGEDTLRKKVNVIIADAKADGTLDALSKKYLGRAAGNLPQ